ncbi:MAG: class I fructose-bisphosphate aldolase [Eubacteriales bacterium]
MRNLGKKIRLGRLFNRKSGKIVGIALDHGLGTPAEQGLASIKDTISMAVDAGADAIMVNKGIAKHAFEEHANSDTSLIIKLGGATRTAKGSLVKIATSEEALYYGADMGSSTFLYNSKYDCNTLELIAELSRECEQKGLPFMVHAYARGELLEKQRHLDPKELKIAVRAAVEIGADIVKTSYPGNKEGFREVLSVCPVPLVIAGGHDVQDDEGFLRKIKDAIDAGACGVMVGTNCWLNKNPKGMIKALIKIVHYNADIEEALLEFK